MDLLRAGEREQPDLQQGRKEGHAKSLHQTCSAGRHAQ